MVALTSDSKWKGGGVKNAFFSVTLYNFQKSGWAIALPAPPPPRSLLCMQLHILFIQIKCELNWTSRSQHLVALLFLIFTSLQTNIFFLV